MKKNIIKQRTCNVCTRSFPASKEYFHLSGNGNFKKECKACRSARRKGEPIKLPRITPKNKIKKSKTYIITYAQNATPINKDFWKSINRYSEYNKAKIVIIAGRYKNPTSVFTSQMEHSEWWDFALRPYIFDNVHLVNKNLSVYANVSIQPTAMRPLSGFEVFTEKRSGIFGHPKIEFKTIPTNKRGKPRILVTTGAITKPNYTDSKAGKKGEGHHTYGAVIVETKGKKFYIRHIRAMQNGSFQDLDKIYTPNEIIENQRIEALICGDIHASNNDETVTNVTFKNKNSIVKTLRPKHIVYHDALDMKARPKYNWNDLRERYERHFGDKINSVELELNNTINYLLDCTPEWSTGHIVASNHDDHLMQWLNSANIKDDPENALIFHKLWSWVLEKYHNGNKFVSPFKLWFENKFSEHKDRLHFLEENENLTIAKHACGFHGHHGQNGSKGTIGAYSKLGVKTVIGHSHVPGIQDQCMQVGTTSLLDHGYNALPSSWYHAHGVLYLDGSKTLIFIIEGRWKT